MTPELPSPLRNNSLHRKEVVAYVGGAVALSQKVDGRWERGGPTVRRKRHHFAPLWSVQNVDTVVSSIGIMELGQQGYP
jgi:hypothetical protein